MLATLALYGLVSTPGLIGRWGISGEGALLFTAWLGAVALAVPLSRAVPSRVFVAALVVVAIGLRLVVAAAFVGRTPAGDAFNYVALANGLTAGRGLSIYEPSVGGTMLAFYPPGYPLLLGGWSVLFGTSTLSLFALNALIDAAAAAMLYRLAAMIGRAGAGRSAAWAYLIWPSVLLSSPLAQKEGLCVLLVLALAVAWLRAVERPGWATAALVGAIAALLALTQPGQAPLGPLFGLALIPLARFRTVAKAASRALPFAVVAMLPWWVRNWLVLGAFVPLTSAGPISLWVGNNPDATGNWLPLPERLRGLPELGCARAAGAMAREWIEANPLAFARLTLTKLVRACGVSQFGIVRLAAMSPVPPALLTALLFPFAQGAHLLLLGGSALAGWNRGGRIPPVLTLLLAACLVQLALFGVWFEFGERHREFVTPFLLLLVACAFARQAQPSST